MTTIGAMKFPFALGCADLYGAKMWGEKFEKILLQVISDRLTPGDAQGPVVPLGAPVAQFAGMAYDVDPGVGGVIGGLDNPILQRPLVRLEKIVVPCAEITETNDCGSRIGALIIDYVFAIGTIGQRDHVYLQIESAKFTRPVRREGRVPQISVCVKGPGSDTRMT